MTIPTAAQEPPTGPQNGPVGPVGTSGATGASGTVGTGVRSGAAGATSHATLPVIMLALATVVAAVASLNVALPSIARDTHATQTQLSWIIDAYALPFTALLLLGGAIGDRYGRRRALIAGLAIFGAGSVAALAVSTPGWLIALRAVLGAGAALVMPATLSTITATFPADQRPRAVGAWTGVAGASALLGVLTSGLLLEFWSWRSVFGLNVALAVVALAATLRVIPESADPSAPRLDLFGALLTVVGLGVTVYSVIEAPTEGWTSPRTLGGIAGGLAVLAGFVAWELRARTPLLDPRLFGHRAFAAGTLSITVQFFGFFGFIFLVLQYLQLVRGDSALRAALSLLPMSLAIMSGARGMAPRLLPRVGARPVIILGLVLVTTGLLVISRLDGTSAYWSLLAGLLPLGAGMGLAMTPATTAITEALPAAKQGVGSAVNDLARELGGALGIAVLGSVMQSTYRDQLQPAGLPDQVVEQARSSLAVASRLAPEVARQAQSAFVDGMQLALTCAAVAAAVAALAVAALLRRDGAVAAIPHPGSSVPASASPKSPEAESFAMKS
ncbi:MFS transporter [Frankia sp. R43]|uniref:MFS transporter n=1 Tax=Frankia sp. R43 TaxID=269536 RepID=UPI000B187AC2|nr:MFS transporter [Frankia sp. R43]